MVGLSLKEEIETVHSRSMWIYLVIKIGCFFFGGGRWSKLLFSLTQRTQLVVYSWGILFTELFIKLITGFLVSKPKSSITQVWSLSPRGLVGGVLVWVREGFWVVPSLHLTHGVACGKFLLLSLFFYPDLPTRHFPASASKSLSSWFRSGKPQPLI